MVKVAAAHSAELQLYRKSSMAQWYLQNCKCRLAAPLLYEPHFNKENLREIKLLYTNTKAQDPSDYPEKGNNDSGKVLLSLALQLLFRYRHVSIASLGLLADDLLRKCLSSRPGEQPPSETSPWQPGDKNILTRYKYLGYIRSCYTGAAREFIRKLPGGMPLACSGQ